MWLYLNSAWSSWSSLIIRNRPSSAILKTKRPPTLEKNKGKVRQHRASKKEAVDRAEVDNVTQ